MWGIRVSLIRHVEARCMIHAWRYIRSDHICVVARSSTETRATVMHRYCFQMLSYAMDTATHRNYKISYHDKRIFPKYLRLLVYFNIYIYISSWIAAAKKQTSRITMLYFIFQSNLLWYQYTLDTFLIQSLSTFLKSIGEMSFRTLVTFFWMSSTKRFTFHDVFQLWKHFKI